MIKNSPIYILFFFLILFSCKNKTKVQQDVKETNVLKIISSVDKTINNNFFDVIDKYKISTVPFHYNKKLLNKYNKNISSDEDIIRDLIGNRINEYYKCIPSGKYNNPLLYSDSLFNIVPKDTPFKINACKILKRFKTGNINVILITGEAIINQEYTFIVCITTENNKIIDYKILSKLIVPDEYNQFGISISKDFLIKSVNYSRYEESLFMIKQTIKINKDANISLLKNKSIELN